MTGPGPLLVRSPLWPDESLYSYLLRLAELNRYPLWGLLRLFLPYESELGPRQDNAFYPKQSQTYERLAGLTRLEPRALYRATPHRFATLLALSHPTVETLAIPGLGEAPALTDQRAYTLRSERQAQFCPLCLQEAAYHRLEWLPVFVLVCLRHQCLLAARCPGCGRAVSVADVVQAACRRCRADLTRARVHSVRGDRFGLFAQHTLCAWLKGSPAPANAWAASMPPEPPAALYYLATRLMGAALSAMDPQTNWKTRGICANLTPEAAYTLWTRVFRTLVAWPEGFYEFCEARTVEALLRDDGPGRADWAGSFSFRPSLLVEWNLAFARRAVASADPDRRWQQPDRRRRARATQVHARRLACFAHMTIPAAARALGTPQVVVERLVVVGRLPGDLEQGEVVRAAVLRLCRRWGPSMSVAEARAMTGLAPAQLRGLLERQAIRRARSEPGVKGRRLARTSVCDFLRVIAARLCPGRPWSRRGALQKQPAQATLDLAESVALAGSVGCTATDLIVLMLKGRLHGCPQASPPDLAVVRFPERHLLSLLSGLGRRGRRARGRPT